LDPTRITEYRAHAEQMIKVVLQRQELTYLDVRLLNDVGQIFDRHPIVTKEIAQLVIGYDRETNQSKLDGQLLSLMNNIEECGFFEC
jgi:hypothetical protein